MYINKCLINVKHVKKCNQLHKKVDYKARKCYYKVKI